MDYVKETEKLLSKDEPETVVLSLLRDIHELKRTSAEIEAASYTQGFKDGRVAEARRWTSARG